MIAPWNEAGYFPGPGLYAMIYQRTGGTDRGLFQIYQNGEIVNDTHGFTILWDEVLYWIKLDPAPTEGGWS